MTTIQDRIIKDFKERFTAIVSYEKWSDEDESTKLSEPQYLWNDLTKHNPKTVEQFLIQSIKEVEEETRKEVENDLENEYDDGFEDGVECGEKEIKKEIISDIESKSKMIKAYENGPLLADSIIITFDDWLEIKSGRKSKISYKSITNKEKQ